MANVKKKSQEMLAEHVTLFLPSLLIREVIPSLGKVRKVAEKETKSSVPEEVASWKCESSVIEGPFNTSKTVSG